MHKKQRTELFPSLISYLYHRRNSIHRRRRKKRHETPAAHQNPLLWLISKLQTGTYVALTWQHPAAHRQYLATYTAASVTDMAPSGKTNPGPAYRSSSSSVLKLIFSILPSISAKLYPPVSAIFLLISEYSASPCRRNSISRPACFSSALG